MNDPTPPRQGVSEERVRELRAQHFKPVLNTPKPTIAELEKILARTDDVHVQLMPNGEVRAALSADSELIIDICDELLHLRASPSPASEPTKLAQALSGLIPMSDMDGAPYYRVSLELVEDVLEYLRSGPSEGERQNERDARRYRFLRASPTGNERFAIVYLAYGDVSAVLWEDKADRAIDAALARGEAKCATCNGRGEVGGPRGQTPESFEYVTEPCPDCK